MHTVELQGQPIGSFVWQLPPGLSQLVDKMSEPGRRDLVLRLQTHLETHLGILGHTLQTGDAVEGLTRLYQAQISVAAEMSKPKVQTARKKKQKKKK